MTESKEKYMREAIRLATENVENNTGGPFGAVVVKDGEIIAAAANTVTSDNDPTAHAEVNAIRLACKNLHTFDLQGCEIYASCEPCPMCLSAIYWARIDKLYYAANQNDASAAGFDDTFIYEELEKPALERRVAAHTVVPEEGQKPFRAWEKSDNKISY